ncbi:cytochrome c oxidase accessory protein CcoG [Spongiibacter sp. KMU-158]|uniref:Cytochrome c oxidase accessory protein CcoG n=1 Tax=Spongiibacter pelagi TaxID=2760804 RepID=A0A927GVS8_9GAMM|nr:cytochrome c oxidase accessory protein CcoG [Spongiibacter pelagi]MBD2858212.1 cytochrome c oxidase accessory protein CcoG [Spongiibacter pelagi]
MSERSPKDKDNSVQVLEFVPAEVAEIDLYQKREKIYTRKIEGFFQRIRLYTGWPLLIGYFVLPWLNWGDRQSVLFDLPERKFHILWMTFWPQDMSMLAWLLIIAAFALFAVTNLAGRVWCGYTCPQTVWTAMFMWIEQKTEGSRNQRIKLDQQPWSFDKFRKKFLKHSMWLGLAFFTGFTFVGYFTPIVGMTIDLAQLSIHPMAAFWIGFFTLATYGNAGWMREQVCKYMCPYARFQSAMFDPDTLIISYDKARGEPRGSRKHADDHQQQGLGDCIDCQLCVQVCPTGIDIRNGLQYECIGCALCIDACDSVMDKMHYPRGLIRYTTENALKGKKLHIIRPRLVGYIVAVALMVSFLGYRMATRDSIVLSVLRDRQALYYTTDSGQIENRYTVKIANKTETNHKYRLSLNSSAPIQMPEQGAITVSSGEVRELNIRLTLAPEYSEQAANSVQFKVYAESEPEKSVTVDSKFFAPGSGH